MKKKLFVFALAAMMALCCFGLAACGDDDNKTPQEKKINLMTGWEGHEEEDVYSISNKDGKLTVTYDKQGTEWAYIKRLVAGEDSATLKAMKTLVFKGKVAEGGDYMLMKVEYGEALNKEVKFYMTGTEKTYEWDLTAIDLSTALRFIFFADPGALVGEGKLEFTEFYLTDKAVNAENSIGKEETPVVMTPNVYTSGDSLALSAGWYDSGDGVYTVTPSGAEFNVSYEKKNALQSYASMKALVKGAGLSDMKTMEITLKGTAGVSLLVKPFDRIEKRITLTGGDDVLKIDVSTVTGVDFTTEVPILIMAAPGEVPGANEVKGSFTIKAAQLNKTQLPKEYVVNEYTEGDSLALNAGWYDNGDNAYTITKAGTEFAVAFDKKAGMEYSAMKALVKGAGLADMKTLQMTLNGAAGTSLLLKPYDKIEKRVTLTGGDDVVKVDLSAVSGVDFTKDVPVLIMAAAGTAPATGSFTIKASELNKTAIPKEYAVNEYTEGESLALSAGWYDNGDEAYVITPSGSEFTVAYDKKAGQEYAAMKAIVKGAGLTAMKTLVVNINTATAFDVIVKPFNAVEKRVTLAVGDNEIKVDISEVSGVDFTAEVPVIIMAAAGTAPAAGSFTIKSAELNKTELPKDKQTNTYVKGGTLNVMAAWYDDNSIYTIAKDGAVYNINYTKTDGYQGFYARVQGASIDDLVNITFVAKGTAGKTLMLKLATGVEKTFTFTGGDDVFTWTLDATQAAAFQAVDFSIVQKIIFMAEPGDGTGVAPVTGSFMLKAFTMSSSLNVDDTAGVTFAANNGWCDGGDGVYTVTKETNGDFTVAYDKTADQGWSTLKAFVAGSNFANFKKVSITVNGTTGTTLLLKTFGNVEKNVTLAGGDETFEIDITGKATAGFMEMLIFAVPGSSAATNGSFTIKGMEFSTTAIVDVP